MLNGARTTIQHRGVPPAGERQEPGTAALWPVPAEGIQQFTAALVSARAAVQPVKLRSYMHHHIKRQ